jgi:serpin B
MTRTCPLVLVVALSIVSAACGSSKATQPIIDYDPVTTTKPVPTTKAVVPLAPVTAAANLDAFAAALLREASVDEPGNVVLSPASFALAFAMAQAGTKGETHDEIAAAFGFDSGTDMGKVLEALTAPSGTESPELNIANGFWETGRLPIRPEFRTAITNDLKSKLTTVEYKRLADDVNGWVSTQTKGRITNLVPKDAIDPDTVSVLVNAIYLKAKWQLQFTKTQTAQPFEGAGAVPSMGVTGGFQVAEGDGYRAIRLPYRGDTMSMVIVVPDDLATFNAAKLPDIRAQFKTPTFTALTMPLWDFETSLQANDTLRRLGITTAFDQTKADFCAMLADPCGPGAAWISAVFHKANITVDTEGTEAAAATAIVAVATSARVDEPRPFNVDRPFIFEIVHEPTGTPLFLGRVIDPSK